MTTGTESVEPRELRDWLLARGRNWITTAEAAAVLEIPARHVAPTLARWRDRGHLFAPTKGLYVAIPPEYSSWGSVPASHFIDPLMTHLGHPYYVAFMSAAEVHGFAHQRPQVFQVTTSARLRDRKFGRVRIGFTTDVSTTDRRIEPVNTPTGSMRVSSIETTVLDLVAHPRQGGGLSNVATIIGEMLEDQRLDPLRLAEVASGYPEAVIRRCGWLLDHMAARMQVGLVTEDLEALVSRRPPVSLVPGGPSEGGHDQRWRVRVNERVEPES